MLFVLMYFMYIIYMLCFCILCLYAIYEWPEFYVNKGMFCSVNKDFCHLLITFANSKDPDQGREECYNPKSLVCSSIQLFHACLWYSQNYYPEVPWTT